MALELTVELNKNFERTEELTEEEKADWRAVWRISQEPGGKERRAELLEQKRVKEIKALMYIPAVWAEGEEPKDNNPDDVEQQVVSEIPDDDRKMPGVDKEMPTPTEPKMPLELAYFMGLAQDGVTQTAYKMGPLNPEWIRRFFKGVYMQLVMLKPLAWWPMVVGNARDDTDVAPQGLLVEKLKLRYQQFDRKQCLTKGIASSLYYCGLKTEAFAINQLGTKYELLTKSIALTELKKDMQKFVPCIGDCEIFNVRNAKKRTMRKMSIKELIEKKTKFPTVVIPWGVDGGNNHSFVVIDDLIFDSTQVSAMKLCQASLDWICGKQGMAKVDVALRFNTSHGTKEKLKHKEKKNW